MEPKLYYSKLNDAYIFSFKDGDVLLSVSQNDGAVVIKQNYEDAVEVTFDASVVGVVDYLISTGHEFAIGAYSGLLLMSICELKIYVGE